MPGANKDLVRDAFSRSNPAVKDALTRFKPGAAQWLEDLSRTTADHTPGNPYAAISLHPFTHIKKDPLDEVQAKTGAIRNRVHWGTTTAENILTALQKENENRRADGSEAKKKELVPIQRSGKGFADLSIEELLDHVHSFGKEEAGLVQDAKDDFPALSDEEAVAKYLKALKRQELEEMLQGFVGERGGTRTSTQFFQSELDRALGVAWAGEAAVSFEDYREALRSAVESAAFLAHEAVKSSLNASDDARDGPKGDRDKALGELKTTSRDTWRDVSGSLGRIF